MSEQLCKNCGAPDALHQYETNHCPRNGMEALVGRKQQWMSTVFEVDYSGELSDLRDKLAASQRTIEAQAAQIAQLTRDLDDQKQRADYMYRDLSKAQNERDEALALVEKIHNETLYLDEGVNDEGDKQISRIYEMTTK